MKKKNIFNSNIIKVIALLIVIILLPILLDNLVIGNSIKSNISNSDWVSFFGSYIGGISGGILSIVGVFLTIKYYKNQDELNRKDREKFILAEIKKQHEIKYRFEFLEELELVNRSLNLIFESISIISILCTAPNQAKEPLSVIDTSIWNEFNRYSTDIRTHFNNLKSIFDSKLSVFYQNTFIEDIKEEVDALIIMLCELDDSCRYKTISEFETDIALLMYQFSCEKDINTITDVSEWIESLKNKFTDYTACFKKTI